MGLLRFELRSSAFSNHFSFGDKTTFLFCKKKRGFPEADSIPGWPTAPKLAQYLIVLAQTLFN